MVASQPATVGGTTLGVVRTGCVRVVADAVRCVVADAVECVVAEAVAVAVTVWV